MSIASPSNFQVSKINYNSRIIGLFEIIDIFDIFDVSRYFLESSEVYFAFAYFLEPAFSRMHLYFASLVRSPRDAGFPFSWRLSWQLIFTVATPGILPVIPSSLPFCLASSASISTLSPEGPLVRMTPLPSLWAFGATSVVMPGWAGKVLWV